MNQELYKKYAGAVIRWAMGVAGTALAEHGLISGARWTKLTPIITGVLLMLGWSLWEKNGQHWREIVSRYLPAGVTLDEVKATLNNPAVMDEVKKAAATMAKGTAEPPKAAMIAVPLLLLLGVVAPARAQGCDKNIWTHVYKPARLKILAPCVTVTGTLMHSKKEADGDLHMQLKLDPPFAKMLNTRNVKVQKGCLVIEPICQHFPVTQADAISACKGFKSALVIPKMGTRVAVTGPFVVDNEANHGWQEIHAPTTIRVIQ